jgi:AraC family transcriptional regulator of arabinose operon
MHNPAIWDETPDPGLLLADHYVKEFGYRGFRPNGTKAWLLLYTLSGEGVVRIDDSDWKCRKHNAAFLKPGAPHHYFTAENSTWDFYWAYYTPRTTWSDWMIYPETMKGLFATPISIAFRQRIEQAFERMVKDSRQLDPLQQELSLNALEEILLLVQKEQDTGKERRMDPRIRQVLDILNNWYEHPHTIEDLANTICLSPSRLSHLFKEQTGEAILETLIHIRLKQGARLLTYTSMTIGEIAEQVGFHSANYFSRKFSSFYGISPILYRNL